MITSATVTSGVALRQAEKTVTLADVATIRSGYAFPPRLQGRRAGTYPFYKVSDMNLPGNEVAMAHANHWITTDDLRVLKARPFPVGTIIFPKVGAAIATNKKRILTRPALVDNNVMGVLPDIERCVPDYLLYWLLTVDLSTVSSPGALPSITARAIGRLPLSLPSLDEQQRIAQVLSTLQQAKAGATRVAAASRVLLASLLAQFFAPGGDTVPLGTIADIKGGKRLPKGHSFADKVGRFPYVRIVDFADGSVNTTNLKYLSESDHEAIHRYIIRATDVYISIAGTIGLVGTVPAEMDGANLTENAARIVIHDPTHVAQRFLYWYLASEMGQAEISLRATKTSQPKLALMRIAEIPIPTPDIGTQRKVVDALDVAQAKIVAERDNTDAIDRVFLSTLAQLLPREKG